MSPSLQDYLFVYLLPAALIALLFGFNTDFKVLKESWREYCWSWFRRSSLLFPIVLAYFWIWQPALTGPIWGLSVLVIEVPVLVLSFMLIAYAEERWRLVTRMPKVHRMYESAHVWLAPVAVLAMLHPFLLAVELAIMVVLFVYLLLFLYCKAVVQFGSVQFTYYEPSATETRVEPMAAVPEAMSPPTEEAAARKDTEGGLEEKGEGEAEITEAEGRFNAAAKAWFGALAAWCMLQLQPDPNIAPKTLPYFPHHIWRLAWIPVVAFLWVLVSWAMGSVLIRPQHFSGLIGPVEKKGAWSKDFEAEEFRSAVVVERNHAILLAERALGQSPEKLGSRFHPSGYTKQRVRGEIVWVAPLEFNDLRHFWTSRTSPGYVVVKAETLSDSAQLVLKRDGRSLELSYLQTCWSTQNLTRHVYSLGYTRYQLGAFGFELDEDLKPWWVITLLQPSSGFEGQTLEGMLLVDPETGETEFHAPEEIPAWIDTVLTPEMALERAHWWGQYKGGIQNRFVSNKDMASPSIRDPRHVMRIWSKKGEPYYVIGMSIPQGHKRSLISYLCVHCRTGQATEFAAHGADETAAYEAVRGKISNFRNWHPDLLTLRNIGGRDCLVGPVIAEGVYQRFGLVDVKESICVVEATPHAAYRQFLTQMIIFGHKFNDNETRRERLTIIAKAVQPTPDGVQFSFMTKELSGRIISAPSSLSQWLRFSEIGDTIDVRFLDFGETEVQAVRFENLRLK